MRQEKVIAKGPKREFFCKRVEFDGDLFDD